MFVRQDIPLADQIVQSNHAVLTIASSSYDFSGIPNIILIGLPNKSALDRAQRKLADASIPHCAWIEPDNDMGFTSLATVPIGFEQKEVLVNYRLWCPLFPCSSEKEQSATHKVAERSVVQFHPGEPNSQCAISLEA